ncbi:hypothetical protein XNMGNQLM_CDS0177 [Escherichia phage MIZ6]|nr:hypothetical protein XNMGNQLM_CDS0177 [Escherichia phage MIZ6]WNA14438.1 hypothetical protein SILIKYPJ_CDS0177 [Krischvirus RB49]WNA14706.1 hypothetical protein YCRUBIWT_CDS0177 [Krischvirus RB49]
MMMFCVLSKEVKLRKLEIGDGVVVKMHASTLSSFNLKESFLLEERWLISAGVKAKEHKSVAFA